MALTGAGAGAGSASVRVDGVGDASRGVEADPKLSDRADSDAALVGRPPMRTGRAATPLGLLKDERGEAAESPARCKSSLAALAATTALTVMMRCATRGMQAD
jgi:hypothetical protein